MDNKGLLFIPDISGFTQFVNKVEIDHSRQIIQELLEVIINANQLGLEVSEIEGDAVLFYKFGEMPDINLLYDQVVKMFCDFHRQLITYDQFKYCQCTACRSMVNLSLKIITHYGEFTGYNVKNFSKLIGKDVIIAHLLLKNNIEQHEYWLVTSNLLKSSPPNNLAEWMEWNSSFKETENGQIQFHYTQLSELKKEIMYKPKLNLEISNKTKLLTFTKEYETDIITLFHASGDFNYRSKWLEGVKSVEVYDHHLPRIGMKCRCILDNEQDVIFSSNYSWNDERIEFSETDEKKMMEMFFILEKLHDKKTKLTIEFYIRNNILIRVLFNLFRKKKMEMIFSKSLLNLEKLVKEIKLPE